MTVSASQLRSPRRGVLRASRVVQVRFTDEQHELLRLLSQRSERPLSQLVRDVVTVWALNALPEPETDAEATARSEWVRLLVKQLHDLDGVE